MTRSRDHAEHALNIITTDGGQTINGGLTTASLNVSTPTVPTSATATGTTGDIAYDSNFIYVCVATNTWKRSALTTW